MKLLRIILFLLSLLPAIAYSQERQSLITPTEPVHLVSSKLAVAERFKSNLPEREFTLWMPKGYSASLYTGRLDGNFGWSWPRLMGMDSSGVIHYADMSAKKIRALHDADNDGLVDSLQDVTIRLDSSNSFAFYKGALYVAQATRIRKFYDDQGDGFYEREEPFIGGLPSYGPFDHWTKTIVFDEAKRKLYVSVGTSCNACRQADPTRSAILEFNDDGSGKRVFASGLRNAIGLAIEPSTGHLWATNADRNSLGDSLPEEIITRIKDGGFYGWPYAYGLREWVKFETDSEYTSMLPLTEIDSQKVAAMELPDYFVAAHSTPLGIHFYRGDLFPKEHRTGFVCIKGSAESSRPFGYKIMRFWEENGVRKIADFITGFSEDTNTYKVWGRPVGITEDRKGNLYVTLDDLRTIMKVSFDPNASVAAAGSPQTALETVITQDGRTQILLRGIDWPEQKVNVTLYSMAGSRVFDGSTEARNVRNAISLQLPDVPHGVYLCQIKTSGEMISGTVAVIGR